MQVRLTRYAHEDETTSSLVAINEDGTGAKGSIHFCFGLEDQKQFNGKVMGETRIPEGEYELELREEMTPLTEKYRTRFHWFTYHIQIKNVPNFRFIYIHIGNTDDDTDGCVLLGDVAYNDPKDFESTIGKSTQAFERFYKKVAHKLRNGERVTIKILSIYE